MLTYPEIDPIAFRVGPLAVHWYGIMYLVGFAGGYGVNWLRTRKPGHHWTSEQLGDLLFYVVLGIVIGGRLGYVVFYNLGFYVANPLRIFAVWDGGMSFHGGLIGVLVAMGFYARRHGRSFFDLTDFVAPAVPIGLGTGRIGNFINGELWGRVSFGEPWAMRLPCWDGRFSDRYCGGSVAGYSAPHVPNQLYEAFLEGLVMFVVLWWFSAKPRPRMAVSGLFALLYGVFRFAIEFERLPDPQLGYLAFGWLTMGQVLSLPLIAVGIALLGLAYRNKRFAAAPPEPEPEQPQA